MEYSGDKKVTIDEVAKLCEVSKTTISRYLNGKYENISEATCRRIKKVIEELDYRPNRTAQRLKASRSMLIGCVIGDIGSHFSGILLRGITKACNEAGYQVLFADSGEDGSRERAAIQELLDNQVDGLIVNTTGENDSYLVELCRAGIPVALADRGISQADAIDTVTSTNEELTYQTVSYLMACGYGHVAFFTEGNKRIYSRVTRHRGYLRAAEVMCPEVLCYEFDRHEEGSCTGCLQDLIDRFPDERVAILSVNGMTGLYVQLAMKELGIQGGRNLGHCTFDDWEWMKLSDPSLTAIRLNSEEIGARCAQLLLERIRGTVPMTEPGRMIALPGRIIARKSTVME